MNRTNRNRILRWAVPAAAVAAVALAASGVLTADANPPLPPKTAAALLVDLQHPDLSGFSGTVVQKSDLGLPLSASGGNARQESLATLLTGSHTVRVWNAGPTRQRVALLDPLGESDVIHNGTDLWLWNSGSHSATHFRLPASVAERRPEPVPPAGMTPQEAADAALRAIDPTTAVTTDGTRSVAGRATYELVLGPRDGRSLIGEVRLAVDAETHLPLRVQVYSRGANATPAFEVGFTRINYAVPGDEQFAFSPPDGVTVTEGDLGKLGANPHANHAAGATPPRTVGKGWTTVLVLSGVPEPDGGSGRNSLADQLGALVDKLPKVSGTWGSGRLLTSKLLNVLLTDDGRLLVGAVQPDLLYAAAGHR